MPTNQKTENKTTAMRLHYSPALGRYARCVAKHGCYYGDAHTSLLGLAQAGGADVSTYGRDQVLTVSPVVDGVFSVGTEKRRETFQQDGEKLTPYEAAKWRRRVAERIDEAEAEPDADPIVARVDPVRLAALGWGMEAPRAASKARMTNPKDFELAESSTDAGVLAQLAHSADPGVRLVVAQNHATATDTLEELAVTDAKGSAMYRKTAQEELEYRYQEMRDAAELEACKRMDADGVFQKQLAAMPNYRQLAYMPAQRWAQKPEPARRTLVRAAFEEAAKALKVAVRFGGFARYALRRSSNLLVGKGSGSIFKLSAHAVRKVPRDIMGIFAGVFSDLIGGKDPAKRVGRKLGLA